LITFGYNNTELLKKLTERGKALKKEEWAKIDQVNQEITNMLQDDVNHCALKCPTICFVTLDNAEGPDVAEHYNEVLKDDDDFEHFKTLLGDNLELKPACEPSDILWENKPVSNKKTGKKKFIIYGSIFLMLLASFVIMFALKKRATFLKNKYPSMQCANMQEIYAGNPDGWQRDSIKEFIQNEHIEKSYGDRAIYSGPLQCYCKEVQRIGSLGNTI